MFAGVDNASAEDAWYETALKLEQYQLLNKQFAGSAADIYKCFDQISRPLLYRLARTAGIPPKILDAYQRYREGLTVHNNLQQDWEMHINGQTASLKDAH